MSTGERPDRRRLAGAILASAAVLALVGAGAGIRRRSIATNRRSTQTRQQIAVQGPKIVEDTLSYAVASIDADFARARSLVTDGYRPQLIAQQDAVRKAGPVDNDYWVTNSAVLSNPQDRAEMLLLMQGQRGAAPNQRLITATVQADFEKSADGQWQVANLTGAGEAEAEAGRLMSPRAGSTIRGRAGQRRLPDARPPPRRWGLPLVAGGRPPWRFSPRSRSARWCSSNGRPSAATRSATPR